VFLEDARERAFGARPGMTRRRTPRNDEGARHRPCSCVGAGYALFANCNSRLPSRGAERRQALGLARPPVGGLRNTPGGTSYEASRSSVAKRRNAPSGAPRRRSAMRGPRFRERGPATPVSQLLAAGRNACERSPAIARESGVRCSEPAAPHQSMAGFPRSSTRWGPAASPALSPPPLRLHGVP